MNCFEIERPVLPPVPCLLVVAAALIDRDGRVLIARRPEGKAFAGMWEFPGGKVEAGETPEQALVRELAEELAIDTSESCLAPISFASQRYEKFHVVLPFYACRVWKGTVVPQEGQECRWVYPREFDSFDMLPSALPLLPALRDLL